MRRSSLVVVVAGAGCLVGLACGGYGESDTEASPPADAGDASVAANDGGADTATIDTGPSTFCASKTNAAWCEDFDTIIDVGLLVPEHSADMPEATLSQKNFYSSPRSLRFTALADKPATQYSVVAKSFATDKDVRAEIAWRWAAAFPSEAQTLQTLTVKKGIGQASFGRACGTLDAGVVTCGWYVATCVANRTPLCRIFPIAPIAALDAWSHVALQVHFAPKGHVLAEEDGKPIVDVDDDIELTPSSEPTNVTVGLGVLQGSTSGTEVFFDDVVVELR